MKEKISPNSFRQEIQTIKSLRKDYNKARKGEKKENQKSVILRHQQEPKTLAEELM